VLLTDVCFFKLGGDVAIQKGKNQTVSGHFYVHALNSIQWQLEEALLIQPMTVLD
jgi:hypothetical protein